jgi:hypothetical protein
MARSASLTKIFLLLMLPARLSLGDCLKPDYHADPIVDWSTCDFNGGPVSRCKHWNEETGGSLQCPMDQKSFDAHYKAEAKKPKANDRDNSGPAEHCSAVLQRLLTDGDSLNQFLAEKKVAQEFNAKVKTLTCRFEADEKKTWTLELKGTDLVLTVGLGTANNPTQFLVDGLRKSFPAFKASWDEHH